MSSSGASGGQPAVWTIRRSTTDAKLAGLCGGVARHWNVDPLLVRVGWVLAALSGVGLVAYAAGWLLVPQDGRTTSTLDEFTGGASTRWSREAKLAAVIIASVVAFIVFGGITGIGIGPVLVLAAIWYFGYYRQRRSAGQRQSPPPPPVQGPPPVPFQYPGPATPFTTAATAWRERMEAYTRSAPGGTPAPSAHPATSASPVPPAPTWPLLADAHAADGPQDPTPPNTMSTEEQERAAFLAAPDPVGLYTEPERAPAVTAPSLRVRGRSLPARRLRLVGLVTLGLALAGLGIADGIGVAVPVAAYLAVALLVVGLTLIAATWLGRARGILPVGVVLLVGLLSVAVVHPGTMPRDWSVDRTYTSAAALPTSPDEISIGRLQVDLSQLTLTRDATYTAHADIGQVSVLVPDDVNVRVRYQVDEGAVVDQARTIESGSDIDGVIEPPRLIPGVPTLTVTVSADLGEVEIRR